VPGSFPETPTVLIIPMPTSFKVGDTADVRINGEPQRITYRNTAIMVIEPDDVRPIQARHRSGDENMFYCGESL
jgi:hypothetical protein